MMIALGLGVRCDINWPYAVSKAAVAHLTTLLAEFAGGRVRTAALRSTPQRGYGPNRPQATNTASAMRRTLMGMRLASP